MTTGTCPNCGYELTRATRFCPRCGRDLHAAQGAGAPQDVTNRGPRRSPASTRAWIAAGAAVVVALVAVAVVARTRHHASPAAAPAEIQPARSVAASRSHETTTTFHTFVPREYSIGDCVTWNTTNEGQTETSVVPCDQPHLVEIIGKVDLERRLHHLPSDSELQLLFGSDCRRAASVLLGHPVDDQKMQLGGFYPKRDAFERGDHTLWCWGRKPRSKRLDTVPYRGALT